MGALLPACDTLPSTNCTRAADAVPLGEIFLLLAINFFSSSPVAMNFTSYSHSDFSHCLNSPPNPIPDRSKVVCPSPLIRNSDPSVERETCPGGICCVACPYAVSFYPEGELVGAFKAIIGINLFFSILALLTVVIYLIIPSKRAFPQNIVLFMSCAILFVYLIFWLGLVPTDQLLCASDVETAMAGSSHNLPLCKFQGSVLIYGVLASILWFSILGINVFLVSFTLFFEEERSKKKNCINTPPNEIVCCGPSFGSQLRAVDLPRGLLGPSADFSHRFERKRSDRNWRCPTLWSP